MTRQANFFGDNANGLEPPASPARLRPADVIHSLMTPRATYRVSVEYMERPGLPPLHVVELAGPGPEPPHRVALHREGLLCTCPDFRRDLPCEHCQAARLGGLFPELDVPPVMAIDRRGRGA